METHWPEKLDISGEGNVTLYATPNPFLFEYKMFKPKTRYKLKLTQEKGLGVAGYMSTDRYDMM